MSAVAVIDPAASPLAPAPARVVARRVEAPGVVTLRLAADGRDLAEDAAPGRFCMLWVPGVGESAISVSAVHADGTSSHTVKAVGAVTRALCALGPHDVVGVRGPFGRGWDLAPLADADVVVVGGGIGLAPLRPAIEALRARPRGRLAALVGARTPGDLLFAEDRATWAADPRVALHVTVDRGDPAWSGDVGMVTRLLARLDLDHPDDPDRPVAALVCGPEVMARATARALEDRGVAGSDVQVSLERNMRCGIGHCGHCQLGPFVLCRQGPVHRWCDVAALLEEPER